MSERSPAPAPAEAGLLGGVVAWMTRNHVAANLLMLALLLGGVASTLSIKQEVYPSFQLVIVMLTIPFATGAAPLGHIILDYDLSIVSVFGMIALAGLSVNGGLVLNQEINRLLRTGMQLRDAIVAAGRRRFRPILLTSLTTFAGLAPMIFETSSQARFLVPMAIALGFGTLFTAPVVILLPSCLRLLIPIRSADDIEATDETSPPNAAGMAPVTSQS